MQPQRKNDEYQTAIEAMRRMVRSFEHFNEQNRSERHAAADAMRVVARARIARFNSHTAALLEELCAKMKSKDPLEGQIQATTGLIAELEKWIRLEGEIAN